MGEETSTDPVVSWTRAVKGYETGLSRLQDQPLADRDMHWDNDIDEIKKVLETARTELRRTLSQRDSQHSPA